MSNSGEDFKNMFDIIMREKDKEQKERGYYLRRCYAPDLLARILIDCGEKKCPTFDEYFHETLVDISIAGFLLHSINPNAQTLLDEFYNCKYCTLSSKKEIKKWIDADDNQLANCNKESARRRKAFWAYMKNNKDSKRTEENYFEACTFLDKMIEAHTNSTANLDFRILLDNHKHIANGIDLMRYCFLRHKF